MSICPYVSPYITILLFVGIKVTLKKFIGKWNLRFPKIKFNIVFKPGKITLNGKKIKVVPSKNKRYPATKGWVVFKFKNLTYYIRKTKIGVKIFRLNKKGKKVVGKGVKGVKGESKRRREVSKFDFFSFWLLKPAILNPDDQSSGPTCVIRFLYIIS